MPIAQFHETRQRAAGHGNAGPGAALLGMASRGIARHVLAKQGKVFLTTQVLLKENNRGSSKGERVDKR
jgi:hypothetical protein